MKKTLFNINFLLIIIYASATWYNMTEDNMAHAVFFSVMYGISIKTWLIENV